MIKAILVLTGCVALAACGGTDGGGGSGSFASDCASAMKAIDAQIGSSDQDVSSEQRCSCMQTYAENLVAEGKLQQARYKDLVAAREDGKALLACGPLGE